MIKFQHKNKRKITKTTQQKFKIHQSVIKKSDVQLTDILINGVQLPGYRKLNDHRRNKQTDRYLSNRFHQINRDQSEQEIHGLFKNTAIRTRLKSLDIQINITADGLQENSNQRKSTCQRKIPLHFERLNKTSTFMYEKARSQRYSSAQTVFNWTHRTVKEKHNIEQSVRSHSTKNRTQNPLWISQNNIINYLSKKDRKITDNGSRLSNSKGFNDSLRAQKQDFLSLRKSEGIRDIPQLLITPKNDTDGSAFCKSIFRQSPYSLKSKNKVCYSIRQGTQQKQTSVRNTVQRTSVALPLPDYEQQEGGYDI